MKQYLEYLKRVVGQGDIQFNDRTKMATIGVSASSHQYDLRNGFPLLTTKKMPPSIIFGELFWKLRGERNVKPLLDENNHIWDRNAFDHFLERHGRTKEVPKNTPEWDVEFKAYIERLKKDPSFEKEGDLGPVYGNQWRHWKYGSDLSELVERVKDVADINIFERIPKLEKMKHLFVKDEVDQLTRLLDGIRKDPGSRYHTLCSWNSGYLPDMALGPCPFWHQFTVYGDQMDLTMVQRSCDSYLGVPFNIAQDSLLLQMVAQETGYKPRFFNHHLNNAHVYLGVAPRSDFWIDPNNVKEFQRRFNGVNSQEGFLDVNDWYVNQAGPEAEGQERKDHMPFILEQLSKEPRELPTIVTIDVPLLEAIKGDPKDYVTVHDYHPHEWDNRAVMAA